MLCFWLMAICVNVQQGSFATIAPNYLGGVASMNKAFERGLFCWALSQS